MDEAERYYLESLEIWRHLANINPTAFEPDIAITCYYLGLLESQKGDFQQSKNDLERALTVSQKYPHLATWERNTRNALNIQ